ncbi:hypothetical protein YC2023_042443 [Brassica napus]
MVNGCEGTESSNAATAKTPEPSGRPQQKGSYVFYIIKLDLVYLKECNLYIYVSWWLYCVKERLSGDQFEELKAFIDIEVFKRPGMIRKVVREWVSDMLLIDGKSTERFRFHSFEQLMSGQQNTQICQISSGTITIFNEETKIIRRIMATL